MPLGVVCYGRLWTIRSRMSLSSKRSQQEMGGQNRRRIGLGHKGILCEANLPLEDCSSCSRASPNQIIHWLNKRRFEIELGKYHVNSICGCLRKSCYEVTTDWYETLQPVQLIPFRMIVARPFKCLNKPPEKRPPEDAVCPLEKPLAVTHSSSRAITIFSALSRGI